MASLACALLGSVEIARDGEPVTRFATDKVRALLVYLVVEAGRAHRRDELAELLWPDQPPSAARNSLRQALALLRQALGAADARPPFLLISREWVQCNPAAEVRLDVAQFTALLAACEQHAHTRLEGCTPCAQRLAQAASLYRGTFLQDITVRDSVAFEEWALLKRDGLQRGVIHALHRLAAYHERRRAYQEAEQYAWRQVALDPWREEAHQQLMRVLALGGQRSAALQQYETCRRILADELGVEPMEETTALYEQIRTGTLARPAARPSPVHSLPPQPTSFVGRGAERAELAERLT
ncbi:MAG: winged helix-turn-helix domain-containing protein, partial [Chloroflexota bacterium]|nr:winged helix-turn-helix domain-containing protein [Chloroflexota bacterium]